MGLIWIVITGFCVGLVAKFIVPGREGGGFIMTTVLGIAGSWFGSLLAGMLGRGGRVGFIGSVIGAALLLVIYNWTRTKKTA